MKQPEDNIIRTTDLTVRIDGYLTWVCTHCGAAGGTEVHIDDNEAGWLWPPVKRVVDRIRDTGMEYSITQPLEWECGWCRKVHSVVYIPKSLKDSFSNE